MAIFKHGEGDYRRYPPGGAPAKPARPADEYTADANWKQKAGAPKGIQIHRDGKTMRNAAPLPVAKK